MKTRIGNKLWALCKHLNLRVLLGNDLGYELVPLPWNSRKLVRTVTLDLSVSDLMRSPRRAVYSVCTSAAHELGHYLVAPEGRRQRKDYGIPEKAFAFGREPAKWNLDEAKAQLVENHILMWCNLPYRKDPLRNEYMEEHTKKGAKSWWRTVGKNQIDSVLKEVK